MQSKQWLKIVERIPIALMRDDTQAWPMFQVRTPLSAEKSCAWKKNFDEYTIAGLFGLGRGG